MNATLVIKQSITLYNNNDKIYILKLITECHSSD